MGGSIPGRAARGCSFPFRSISSVIRTASTQRAQGSYCRWDWTFPQTVWWKSWWIVIVGGGRVIIICLVWCVHPSVLILGGEETVNFEPVGTSPIPQYKKMVMFIETCSGLCNFNTKTSLVKEKNSLVYIVPELLQDCYFIKMILKSLF